MSPLVNSWRSAASEQGAVLVIVALFAPVVILMASFAIDVGNSFLHARHLQVQADAAAFAGAQEFQPCVNQKVYERAGQYGGAVTVTPPGGGSVSSLSPLYNVPVGGSGASNLHELINSRNYYKQTSPSDDTAEEAPCREGQRGVQIPGMLDVKITEDNLPWYFKIPGELLGGVPHDNAHARVQARQQTQASKVEPLAVAESAPIAARAYFVNEDAGNATLASVPLANTGKNALGQDVWSNSTAPLALAINKTDSSTAHIGVVIALSGSATDTKCGDTYVKCFDQGGTGPLLHIAGYSNAGTGTLAAPLARQVNLSTPVPNTCSDGYFSVATSTCTLTIAAKVDYGSTNTKGVTVTPEVGGVKGSAMTFSAETGLWTGTATLTAGSGSREVNLLVKCAQQSGSPCAAGATSATIKNVHRTYAASSEHSDSIGGAWIGEAGGAVQDANSFEVCEAQNGNSCTHKLVVTVDTEGSLADASEYNDPLFHMRFGNPQAEVIGCPPPGSSSASVYRENLASGCRGTYKINTSDPDCTSFTEPYDCIGFASGVKTGPFSQGLNERFAEHPPTGTRFYECNNWVKSNGGGVPLIPKDDSRVVQLFIEPYGSDGSKNVPIQDFATFYVTGWDGETSKCKTHPDDSAAKGEIVGHFIKYVNVVDENEGGSESCSANSLGQCIIVLTR
jgi:putative Flp pilus-assembly TadE/G-like protein